MEKIFNILNEIRPEFNFEESQHFIEDGLLDSFDIVALVNALEENYGIIIDALDIVPENFESVDSIKNLIVKSGFKFEE